ncbi:glycosyltransferase family 2 protein [Paenibacillus sp. FSL R7-0652]|uniref:glycosyltransferase family 2 protein n=1 Tax=Paenibacillus sp. FSL R7-0652 TaxID=2921687 RepID=UPI003159C779
MQNRLLGIHMIVQNEERHLSRCLNSLKQAGLEMFITDTGSSDRTPDIARNYGATVLHASWEDDFAKARNISLPLAASEWILCLDADEYVIEGLEELMHVLPNVHKSVTRLRITIENQLGDGPENKVLSYPVRLFRAHHGYRYTGRIHEQLVRQRHEGCRGDDTPAVNESGRRTDARSDSPEARTADEEAVLEPLMPLRIHHDGYLASVITAGDKPKRNLRLIELELADQPAHPFHLYNLGVTHCQLGSLEQAADAFTESLRLAALQAPYRPTLVKDLTKVLTALKRYEEAHMLLAAECHRYPAYADLHLIYGEILECQGLQERAYGAYARASTCHSRQDNQERAGSDEAVTEPVYVTEAGSGSYRAYTSMARLAQKRGFVQEAVGLYELALKHLSTYEPAWTGLADALQQQGISDEQIADRLLNLSDLLNQRDSTDQADQSDSPHCSWDRGTELIQIVYALAECGAYKQALQLLGSEASDLCIPAGDRIHWLLCAGQVTDAWHLAEDRWGEPSRKNRKQVDSGLVNAAEVQGVTTGALRAVEKSDWALACWAIGKRLTPSFLATSAPPERDMWKVADRLLYEYRYQPSTSYSSIDVTEAQLLQWSEAAQLAAKQVVTRAVQSGQLLIAQELQEQFSRIMPGHERNKSAIRRSFAGLLYRYGYTMIAAEMLIQCMTEGELDAEGLFWLGETLYAKGHSEQALSLFEQALERRSDLGPARAGAAVCYLRMAVEIIRQEQIRSPENAALGAQRMALELQLRTAEGIPWRTVYGAKERRNRHAGTAAPDSSGSGAANLPVHDREG